MQISGALRAAGVTFLEDFRSAAFLARNGGELYGDAYIDHEGFHQGTTGYATHEVRGFHTSSFTCVVRFTPRVAWDTGTTRYLIDTESGNRTFRVLLNTSNQLVIEVEGTSIFTVSGGASTWSDHWIIGQEVVLVISAESGDSFYALDGHIGTSATTYTADGQIRVIFIDASNAGASTLNATIRDLMFIDHAVEQLDEPVLRNNTLISDIRSDRSLITLPLERDYAISGVQSTPLEGTHKSVLAHAQMGDGSTASTFPTRTPHKSGYSFDGGDYIEIPHHPDLSFTSGGSDVAFSMSLLLKMDDASVVVRVLIQKAYTLLTREYRFLMFGDSVRIFLHDSNNDFIGRYVASPAGIVGCGLVPVIVTYDGSELIGGVRIYIHGIRRDDADLVSGTYNGISDLGSVVRLGDAFLGSMAVPTIRRGIAYSPIQVRAKSYMMHEEAGL